MRGTKNVIEHKSAGHARRVMVAYFREFLLRHPITGGWGRKEPQVELLLESYSFRLERSEGLDQLASSEVTFEGFRSILYVVQYAYVTEFLNCERHKPLEVFDHLTHLSTRELERRAEVFEEVSKLLHDPNDTGEYSEAFVDHDASAKVAEIARQYRLARDNRDTTKGVYHFQRPPVRQPGPARMIGENVDYHLANWPINRRDRLSAQLYLDFFGDSSSPAVVEDTAKRIYESLKPSRRNRRGESAGKKL